MDLIGGFFIVTTLAILSYLFTQKQTNEDSEKANINISQDMEKRRKIMETVDEFINSALFFEHIATWKGMKIYKYILNGIYLYEFEEIMLETKQRIGLSDENLCFKQLSYKRCFDIVKVESFSLLKK